MFAPYWKAVIAFLTILGTNFAATAADPAIQAVAPQGVTGWITAFGTSAIGGALVWLKTNQHTVESIDAAIDTLPVEDLTRAAEVALSKLPLSEARGLLGKHT